MDSLKNVKLFLGRWNFCNLLMSRDLLGAFSGKGRSILRPRAGTTPDEGGDYSVRRPRYPSGGAGIWLLSADVGSPHHLVAQGVEEAVVDSFHYLDGVRGLGDGQAGGLPARLAASVDGHQEVVAPAFHVEGYLTVVADDDGADVEAVGCHGGEGDGPAVRCDDGASHAERVGRRAGGGGHDESVGLIGGQGHAVDGGPDGDHGGTVPLQYGDFIQCVWLVRQARLVTFQLQYATFLNAVAAFVQLVEGVLHFFGRDVCQESQAACIDAQDGDAFTAYAAGCFQEGAVAAQADDHIGLEMAVVEQLEGR